MLAQTSVFSKHAVSKFVLQKLPGIYCKEIRASGFPNTCSKEIRAPDRIAYLFFRVKKQGGDGKSWEMVKVTLPFPRFLKVSGSWRIPLCSRKKPQKSILSTVHTTISLSGYFLLKHKWIVFLGADLSGRTRWVECQISNVSWHLEVMECLGLGTVQVMQKEFQVMKVVGKPDFSSILIWNFLMHIYFEVLFPKDVADRWVWSDWEVGVAILLRQSFGLSACSLPSGNCLVASFQTLMRFSVWCKQPYSWRVFWMTVSKLRQHSLSGFQMVLVGFTPVEDDSYKYRHLLAGWNILNSEWYQTASQGIVVCHQPALLVSLDGSWIRYKIDVFDFCFF